MFFFYDGYEFCQKKGWLKGLNQSSLNERTYIFLYNKFLWLPKNLLHFILQWLLHLYEKGPLGEELCETRRKLEF